jgi:hypothetical protein
MTQTDDRVRSILYVQYAAPGVYPPIERSARIFKQHGWKVRFLGVRALGQSAKLISSLHSEDDIEYHVHTPGGLRALRSYLRFWWRAWQRVRREKPDVVYLSDALSYPAGWLISLTCRAITVQHEHDTPLVLSGLHRLIAPFRKRFIRRADLRINPQADRLRLVQETTGCGEIRLVYNCPSVTELPPDRPFADKTDGLVLWHHGSLGAGRLPLTIIDALADTPNDVRLEFAGYETVNTKGFVDSVLTRARELGIEHRVTFHGAMRRDALYAAASRAHVGLSVFVRKFAEPMVGATNKPFDFLGCTMALLVNYTAEWSDFFGAHGVAATCNPEDSANIAAVIRGLYEDRARLADMATEGRRLIETDWNYEAQFAPVLAELTALVDKRAR